MDENSEEFKTISTQYQKVKSILVKKATLADRLQVATIILSVTTSGSMWLVLSKVFPDLTLWAGAIISTLTAGITLYIKTTGINEIRAEALSLERDLLHYLGDIKGAATPPVDFSDKHKEFVSRIDQLLYGQH